MVLWCSLDHTGFCPSTEPSLIAPAREMTKCSECIHLSAETARNSTAPNSTIVVTQQHNQTVVRRELYPQKPL